MDRYLKRKNVNENEKASNEKNSNLLMRHKSNSHISFKFAYADDLTFLKPICLVCRKELCNSTMVPAKLKHHLETNHPSFKYKNMNYFAYLLENNKKEMDFMRRAKIVSETALKVSYCVAELVAKSKQPHTVAEKFILPACKIL